MYFSPLLFLSFFKRKEPVDLLPCFTQKKNTTSRNTIATEKGDPPQTTKKEEDLNLGEEGESAAKGMIFFFIRVFSFSNYELNHGNSIQIVFGRKRRGVGEKRKSLKRLFLILLLLFFFFFHQRQEDGSEHKEISKSLRALPGASLKGARERT